MKSLLALSFPFLFLLPGFQEDAAAPTASSGSISGRVAFEGLRPEKLPDLVFRHASDECTPSEGVLDLAATDRSLLFDAESGGVANVVLTIAALGGSEMAAPREARLLMRSARYEPHVVVARPGGSLHLENLDPCCHQVHTFPRRNTALNRSLCANEQFAMELTHDEVFSVKDDIHEWMQAHVFVTDAMAYSVSDSKGFFHLAGLAPGSYAVSWWHETLGRGQTQTVVVQANQSTAVNLKVSMSFDLRADIPLAPEPSVQLELLPEQPQPSTSEPEPAAPLELVPGEPEVPTAVPEPAAEQTSRIPAPAAGTGQVNLLARLKGDLPDPVMLPEINAAESEGCLHDGVAEFDGRDRTLLVDPDSRGIENLVFFLENKDILPQVPTDPVRLDQSGCRFEPHVLVVPLGASLAFANSDETNHNIHTYSRKNGPVNNNVAAGDAMQVTLERAETFEVKCDIHPWMKAYVVVSEASRSGSTSSRGTLLLTDVPPGEYEVSWWHESLGKGKLGTLEVVAGQVTTVEHEIDGKASSTSGRRRRR